MDTSKDFVVITAMGTYDYDRFIKLKANRKVTKQRIEMLIKSLSVKAIINPIIVNEKWEIIEGQGRFEARRIMHLPIEYTMQKGLTIDDCRRLNTFAKVWTGADYVQSYAEAGNENYIRLLQAKSETGMAVSRILRMAGKNTHAKNGEANRIFDGTIVFTEADKERAKAIKEMVFEIQDALCFDKRINDAFCQGVKIMSETAGYNHQRMLNNCKLNRAKFVQASGLEDMLKEFSRIYNYKARGSARLYFEDYMRNKGKNVRNYETTRTEYSDIDASTIKKRP